MKHRFFRKLVVVSVISSALITTLDPVEASAAWFKNYYGNWSYSTEGEGYATGWRQINGIWYFFSEDGQMRTGWVQNDDKWYYMDSSGAMQTGIIQIEGKIHLFSESGVMQKGQVVINDKIYNLDNNGVFVGSDYPVITKGFDYYGNSTIIYLPSQIIDKSASMSSDIPTDGSKQVVQYTVKFKDPDATDSDKELLKTRTVDEDTKMTLYEPTKSGYNFIEWNTKSDGDGTSYEYDDMIKVTKDITLYAQWEEVSTTTTTDTVTKVQSITVSSSSGLTTISTAGGSLQMAKKVYPSDATTQTVTWSVSNGTGEATISTTGKLTAVSDGTVTVKATATDGSGVVGQITITISGQ